ncbi:type II toxin-antitoxin system VapC family toxin [Aliarcobacter lanthieri]|uniref:type II toxin-antitoxin system VapC family toxin n=1 Tax=Aliarcobacter lanthieri TaxID=1355374 RepID=UPI003AAC608B
MKYKYFIATDILIDYIIYDKFTKENTNDSCEYIKNILEGNKNICVVNSSSLIEILYYSKNKSFINKIASLLICFYRDTDKWQVLEENENIIEDTLEYCKTTNMKYKNALQYFCALKSECKAIVSNDIDFLNLDFPVIGIK